MKPINLILLVAFTFNAILYILAVNHWVLNTTGRVITAKIDSPFYMREPQNLIAFLDQENHNDLIEKTYKELIRQRELIVKKINQSIQFGLEVIDEAKCALDFYKIGNALTYTKLSKKYFSRVNRRKRYELLFIDKSATPQCWRYYPYTSGSCCFDHLDSMTRTMSLMIDAERELREDDLEFSTAYFMADIMNGLEKNPMSWKYHTLASFYWRMIGNAYEAIECARRGILLAPRKFRDIPLLSMGTILWRAEKLKDADIVLTAAVDHGYNVVENHIALGTTLAMLYDFSRAIYHLDYAIQLDSSYATKVNKLKKFIVCLDNLNKKSVKMNSYVDFFRKELAGLRSKKHEISVSHEKLIQQQIPLGARYFDSDGNNKLLQRGQYCSTRQLAGNEEPVLFCDFYSELQMRLESKEVDIEALERDIDVNTQMIKQRLSLELHTQFGFEEGDENKRRIF